MEVDTHMEPNVQDINTEIPKIGVYLCHCGGNISDVVNIDEVIKVIENYPGVVEARNYVFMCSLTGQGLIEEDIRTKGINRVVVSACSPGLHELTFRGALQRAGLNPYLYEHVNIREQDSWVHKHDRKAATEKAVRLVIAAIEKVSRQDPLTPILVNAEKSVVIFGAGVSGLNAALTVAGNNLKAYLVEKSDALGGHLMDLKSVYPGREDARILLNQLIDDVQADPNIEILTGTEVSSVSGYVGNFSVELAAKGEKKQLKAGSIIVTTGVKSYQPFEGEFGYRQSPKVVTLPEFIARLDDADYFRKIKSVSFLHCVGSRQHDDLDRPQADGKVNLYCSRICCTATLFAIQNMLDKYPHIQAFDFYKDLRTYGLKHEAIYEDLSKRSVLFFRFPEDSLPEITLGESVRIKSKDVLTWNEEVEVESDLLVLSTGVMPNEIDTLVHSMKLPVGNDRFLLEAHPKLRPVEVPNLGVFIAGGAQAPMDITEAATGGRAAAAKASLLLSSEIKLDPFVARVAPALCIGCEACVQECLYSGAIIMEDGPGGKKARVIEALCKGCGACAAVCPTRAINVAGYSLDQLDAMVESIAKE